MITIVSIIAMWLLAETIRREREQHKKELRTLREVYTKDIKTLKQEYTSLHNAYKARRAKVSEELTKDIQEELKGLNGRVTTPQEAKRKQVLNNALEYLKGGSNGI